MENLTISRQLDKLLYSIERFKEDYENGNKRAAVGDLDYVRDRCTSLIYLILAEIEEEEGKL